MNSIAPSVGPSTATLNTTLNPWTRSAPVSVTVHVENDGIHAEVRDSRPEFVSGLSSLEPGAQEQLVHDAWVVGMRAIMNARAAAQEAQLSNIARTLQDELDEQLTAHTKHTTEVIQQALGEYFDPESGCVGERLAHFIGNDGVLAHQLRLHLGAENSMLASTLARSVGEQSPLFKKLNPSDSEGLVQTLTKQLRQVLQDEHGEFQKAMDPLRGDGAVGKFLLQMRESLKGAESDQAKQIQLALKQLDANNDDSLISQFRRDMASARSELLRAINPALEDSPLAVIHRSLTTLVSSHIQSQQELEQAARKRDEEFHADVLGRLERIETRKRLEQRSSAGGRTFEDIAVGFVQRLLSPSGYLVEPTGDLSGHGRRKVGDATIDFPVDHPFHGCRVVMEAKHRDKYTTSRALAELDEAKTVRHAQVGLFVLARSHAAETFPTFSRCGRDVLVVWDEADPNQAPYLEAAVMVALAIATRKQSQANEGDLKALRDIEERLEKEITRLDRIRKQAESIRGCADKITLEVTKGEQELRQIITDAVATLTALNVELDDVRAEQGGPIVVETP